MTKKDYIQAANLIKHRIDNMIERGPERERVHHALVATMVELFSSDNPRFDERRFRDACKVEDL